MSIPSAPFDTRSPYSVPQGCRLRMLRDRLLIKPLDWDASRTIVAIRHGRPVRGIVVAAGPGDFPKIYTWVTLPDGRRQKISFRYSKRFRPTEIRVGEVVALGGLDAFDGKGYNHFQEIMMDGETHLIIQEDDCCGIEIEATAALRAA